MRMSDWTEFNFKLQMPSIFYIKQNTKLKNCIVVLIFACSLYTRPPIHLLHRIKSILCYEDEGPVSYEDGP